MEIVKFKHKTLDLVHEVDGESPAGKYLATHEEYDKVKAEASKATGKKKGD